MKSKLQLMFCFICLSAIYAGFAHAQGIGDRNRPADSNAGRHSIQGRVFLPDGSPARNVPVSVSSADGLPISVYTDQDGVFQTGRIGAGNYTISVKMEGYPSESEYLTISLDELQGRTFSVVFHLRLPGQKKGDIYSANPLFNGVPKGALDKFKKAADKIKSNDEKAAIPLLIAAITDFPNFAAAHYELGSIYLKERDFDHAIEAFVKAIEIKPDYIDAKFGYGLAMFEKKNYEVSEAVFRDVLKVRDSPEAHLNLGLSLFYLKDIAAAEAELKKANSTQAGDRLAVGHLYLGQIYIQKNQNAQAIIELEKYLELAPKAPNAERIKAAVADLKKKS